MLTLKGYSINCKITLDGKEMYDGPSSYISATNEQFSGGHVRYSPHSIVDDGFLDAYYITPVGKCKVLDFFG